MFIKNALIDMVKPQRNYYFVGETELSMKFDINQLNHLEESKFYVFFLNAGYICLNIPCFRYFRDKSSNFQSKY